VYMPAIVFGAVKVTNVSENGTFNLGDVLQIAPKSSSKANTGGGGSNTGDFMVVNVALSVTNTFTSNISDSNVKGNN